MSANDTVYLRSPLHVLGDDVHVLESSLDVIMLKDAVSTAEIVDYVCRGFRLVNGVSTCETQ